MVISSVFRRVEKKYVVTTEQMKMLIDKLSPFLCNDKYPLYTICNLYYDTEQNDLIRRSIESPRFKEKLRIRSYRVPEDDTDVFLEIKRKYDGTVYKRRIRLTYREAADYLSGAEKLSGGQICDEIEYFRTIYSPVPKMVVAYDRRAFCGREDESLRLTFDSDLRYRINNLSLTAGDYGERLMDSGLHVMELKAFGGIPLEMADVLCENSIYPQPFSKYGKAYTKEILKGREQ